MSDAYTGEIRIFAGPFAPEGWHFCDGSALSISVYGDLYGVIGMQYGGFGHDSFLLPDLRGRVPVNIGDGPGTEPLTTGQAGGAETVPLTADQLPRHSHGLMATTYDANEPLPRGNVPAKSYEDVYADDDPDTPLRPDCMSSAGGGKAHDNISPYLCVNYIICLSGVKPEKA